MCTLYDIPLTFGTGLVLLRLIGNAAVFSLHHITDIDFIYQHIRNSKVFPKGAVLCFRLLIPQAMQTLIFSWIWYAPVIEHTGNRSFSVTLCE